MTISEAIAQEPDFNAMSADEIRAYAEAFAAWADWAKGGPTEADWAGAAAAAASALAAAEAQS